MPKKPVKKAKAKRLPSEARDDVPRVSVTLTDESAYVTRYDPQGRPTATYPVAVGDVAAAFNVFGADTGLLPENALFWQNRGGQMRSGVWLPPAVRTLSTDVARNVSTGGQRGDDQISVPLPGFVFVGKGAAYHIFAAARRPASAQDSLYHAPLPNVHPDGLICAGNVKFPRCAPETIAEAARLFFESGFNHDLSAGKITGRRSRHGYNALDMIAEPGALEDDEEAHWEDASEAEEEGLIEFLRSLQGKRKFPMARLVRAGITVRDLVGGGRA